MPESTNQSQYVMLIYSVELARKTQDQQHWQERFQTLAGNP